MLVLTRKNDQKIVIGKKREIVITILKIAGEKVSIGITADHETPIFRAELLDRPATGHRQQESSEMCVTVAVSEEEEETAQPYSIVV